MHESTGGQPTVSASVSFAAVASACGYREAREEVTLEALQVFMRETKGPGLLQLRTRSGVPENLPRPGISPQQVRQRLMQHLGITTAWLNS
jgi:phosphonopyruvate decarboxylase